MQTKPINFSKYSSFKIGSTYDVTLLTQETPQEEIKKHYLIGACNNTLVGDNPPPLMMLSKEFDYICIKENKLLIGGATPSGKVASFCKKHNIANFEFLSHLPGKVGGLVFMNAGLKEHEIFNHLLNIKTPYGILEKEDIGHGYRFTTITAPILEASFSLEYGFDAKKVAMFKKMRSNQPSTPSAGSCFKNPKNDYAGRVIEAIGLKGIMKGNICFSQEHANFLVNCGNGKFEDAIFLIKEAQKRAFEQFGITLDLEIKILDEEYLKLL